MNFWSTWSTVTWYFTTLHRYNVALLCMLQHWLYTIIKFVPQLHLLLWVKLNINHTGFQDPLSSKRFKLVHCYRYQTCIDIVLNLTVGFPIENVDASKINLYLTFLLFDARLISLMLLLLLPCTATLHERTVFRRIGLQHCYWGLLLHA